MSLSPPPFGPNIRSTASRKRCRVQPEVVHAPRHASRHDTVPAEGRAPEGDGLSYDADEDPGDDSELNASLKEGHDYDGDEGSSDKHPRAGDVSGTRLSPGREPGGRGARGTRGI